MHSTCERSQISQCSPPNRPRKLKSVLLLMTSISVVGVAEATDRKWPRCFPHEGKQRGLDAYLCGILISGVRGHRLLDLRLDRIKVEARPGLHGRELDGGL